MLMLVIVVAGPELLSIHYGAAVTSCDASIAAGLQLVCQVDSI